MGINKFNAEGYYDPTAYKAMINIKRGKSVLRIQTCCVYLLTLCRRCGDKRQGGTEIQQIRRGQRLSPHRSASAVSAVHG